MTHHTLRSREKAGKKKTVKAWALLSREGTEQFYSLTLPIYRRRSDAGNTKTNYLLKKWKVVPCTITYEVPPKDAAGRRGV